MARVRKVLVAGAGLAGPAVARGLAMRGIAVDVIEARAGTAEPGAGLLLTGNALVALDALGAGAAVRKAGTAVTAVRYATSDDQTLFRLAVGAARGWPDFVSIHRAALRAALVDGAIVEVAFATTIDAIEPGAAGVRVRLSSGAEAEYDLVIGADGLHSRLREQVFGAPAAAPIAGYAGWRCVAPSKVELAEPTYLLGDGRTLLLHPLAGGDVYCGAGPIDETLLPDTGTDLERLRGAFAGFAGPAAQFLGELAPATRLVPTRYWEVSQVPWSKHRCVVIGDAAHACAPTLSQGAALAFEDAVLLCELLDGGGALDAALAKFEARRRARVLRVQEASRERMAANRVQGPHATAVRDRILRAVGAQRLEAAWAPLMAPEDRS